MNRFHVYIPVKTEPLRYAAIELAKAGISFASFEEDANVIVYPVPTPKDLPAAPEHGQILIGGHLEDTDHPHFDLLQDPFYLAENAEITAEAALGILLKELPCCLTDTEILILGWGRIGKCLAQQLKNLGANVSVCARKPADLAMLAALRYPAISPEMLPSQLRRFRCIVNTVPATVLSSAEGIAPGCLKVDLASGVFLPGENVISARGLPGKCKPESSGKLIARSVLRYLKGVEIS